MSRWEKLLNKLLPAIYDKPVAFSLRDLDKASDPDINNDGCVHRLRLNCYAIENILLADDCLENYELTPTSFKEKLKQWVKEKKDPWIQPRSAILTTGRRVRMR